MAVETADDRAIFVSIDDFGVSATLTRGATVTTISGIFDNDFVSGGNYPGAVSYFEQRRCFAGTINEPQKIWMTKSGTESNMS